MTATTKMTEIGIPREVQKWMNHRHARFYMLAHGCIAYKAKDGLEFYIFQQFDYRSMVVVAAAELQACQYRLDLLFEQGTKVPAPTA